MITADNDDGKGKCDVCTNYDNNNMGREVRTVNRSEFK
jgi:hypothetical protein